MSQRPDALPLLGQLFAGLAGGVELFLFPIRDIAALRRLQPVFEAWN